MNIDHYIAVFDETTNFLYTAYNHDPPGLINVINLAAYEFGSTIESAPTSVYHYRFDPAQKCKAIISLGYARAGYICYNGNLLYKIELDFVTGEAI